MTPRELMLHVEEYNERMRLEQRNLITQAYLTAAWQRSKKMPPLNRVLSDLKAKPAQKPLQPQTDKQMLAAALQWQKRFEKEG